MQKVRKQKRFRTFCKYVELLVYAGIAPEEQGNGAGTTVATDGGTDIIDVYTAVQMGEPRLDICGYLLGVLFASRVGDKAFAGILQTALSVLFHLMHQLF